MWETIATLTAYLLKFIFEKIAKKKLNDKEFTEYILAHQKRRASAGQSALDWNAALEKAQKELEEEKKGSEKSAQ